MARNHKFFFDSNGSPKARGPASEKILMTFLEVDVQGSDHVCRDLMDDLTAIEEESDDLREFIGNAHAVSIKPDGVTIAANLPDDTVMAQGEPATAQNSCHVALKHFREILEDWEAFILNDDIDDALGDDEFS